MGFTFSGKLYRTAGRRRDDDRRHAPADRPRHDGGARVAYGSGMIPITKMVRSDIVFDIIGLTLIVLLIPIMARLVGFV